MSRFALFAAFLLTAAAAHAGTPVDPRQCARDLASVDRSFADALQDLRPAASPDKRCTAWKRQIDVMTAASAVFARCSAEDARASHIAQMQGSISDFRAMLSDARCP